LPRDIRDIEDYLSPVVLTPGVLVSLLDYINQQLPLIEGMSEQERQRIEDKQRKLQEFLLVMIFSDQIFEQHGIQIFSRGAQAVRDALFQVFRKTYPRYQTLITTPAWRQTLDTYQNVLAGIDIAERRGLEPLVEKKADLARAFEQRSHAGFESYARKFEGLMRVADWRGDTGEIEFTKHPAENLLIEVISADNGLATDQIYVESRRHGYLPKEVDYLLAFLELRGYIEAEDQGEGYRPAHTLSHTELLSTIHAVIIEAKLLKENLPDEAPTKILTKANNLQDLLDDEQADLADAQVKIIQLQRETRKLRPVLVQASYGSLHHQRDQLYSALQHLGKPIPESDTGLQLDKHINGASRHIAKTIRPTVKQLENLREQVVKATNQEFDIENANVAALVRFVDILHDLSQSIEVALSEADKRVSLLAIQQEWVYLIDRIRRLEDSLQIASQVTNTTVLEQRLENTVSQLKQELATIGLENYQGIYDEYNPVIAALNQELAVFVSVGERISSEKDVSVHTDDPSSLAATDEHTQANGKTYIRKQLATHEVSLQQAFEHSNLSAQAFLAWLFTLQSEGALDIQISGIDEDQA
jgi:hypothetical protein